MIIKNVHLVTHKFDFPSADIEISEKGIITKISPTKKPANYLMIPGFIDLHLHGFKGYDVNNGSKDIEAISFHLAQQGVTTFFPTFMTNEWKNLLKKIANGAHAKRQNSRFPHFHLEGPFLGPSKKGAQNILWLRHPSLKDLDELIQASQGKLKRLVLDPLVSRQEVFLYAKEKRLTINLGHSSADYHLAQKALSWGATSACHLWNAMSGFDHQKTGIVLAFLNSQTAFAELICDFNHIKEEVVLFTVKSLSPQRIILISDSILPAYLEDGDYFSGGLAVTKKGLNIRLKELGAIAGSGITIFDAFKNILSLGFSLQEAIFMSSYNAAKHENLLAAKIGTLDVGYYADFLLLDEKMQLQDVYISGQKIKK